MKASKLFFTIVFVSCIGYAKAYAGGAKIGPGPNDNDTTINLKSNIVIFKMIPSPPANAGSPGNGSLKKAGKVARTSVSPHTSIENILYKKKGI